MRHRAGLLLALLGTAGFRALVAEEPVSGEIVVTGDRRSRSRADAPVRTEVIDRRRIEESGAANAAEVLAHQGGLEIRTGIRGRNVQLLGLDPKHVLILVDGERIAGRTDGNFDLTRIKSEEIERIEIVRGPASALYGSDAMAGVINIITRQSRDPLYASTDLAHGGGRHLHFGNGGESRASGSLGLQNGPLSTALSAGWHRGDPFDLSPFTNADRRALLYGPILSGFDPDPIVRKQATTGPAFEELHAGNTTRLSVTDRFSLSAGGSYRFVRQERLDASPPRQLIERTNETHDGTFRVGAESRLPQRGLVRLGYNYSRYEDLLIQDQREADDLDRREVQDERIQEGRIQWDQPLGSAHVLTTGGDFLFEELASPRLVARYAFRQRPAVFVQDEWKVGQRRNWTVVPGVRYEDDSWFGSQTAPKLAMRFDPLASLRLRVSGGAGYRAPTFKEMFFDFSNPGVGYRVVGNPDLRPERSRGYAAGVEHEISRSLFWSVDLFHNSVTNLIDFRLLPTRRGDDLSVFQPQNVRRARTSGGEALFEWKPLRTLGLGIGYTHTDSRDRDLDLPLEGRSRHRGLYFLTFESPGRVLGGSVRGSVFGKQAYYRPRVPVFSLRANGSFAYDPNAYITALLEEREVTFVELNTVSPAQSAVYRNPRHNLDMRFFVRIVKGVEAYVGVDNVLDDYDPVFNPERPRFFYFGVRMSYRETAKAKVERWRSHFEQGLPIPGNDPDQDR